MNKMKKYQPVDPIKSPRFSGIKTFMRLPYLTEIEKVDFGIIGVPSDAGASFRTGQREGPAAIRKVSALLRISVLLNTFQGQILVTYLWFQGT